MALTRTGLVALILLALSGCTAIFQPGFGTGTRNGQSSSLVDYLYPQGEVPPEHSESIPHLDLPLRVGLAFVPGRYAEDDISEAMRMDLLDGVRQQFIQHDYIEHIEVIPDIYLRSSNGIDGMRQIARLYGVDVMALVSYDQVIKTTDNNAAFLYWTIIGAYLVEGSNSDVQTFVDTAVFDVDTAKLLFRAPGMNRDSATSTAIRVSDEVHRQSEASFTSAVDDMTGNLDLALVDFERRVAENPAVAEVTYREGYGGIGSFDGLFLLLLAGFAIVGIGSGSHQGYKGRFRGL